MAACEGAVCPSPRLCVRGLRGAANRPLCGSAHENEAYVVWDCPRWHGARESCTRGCSPWATITHLGPPEHWLEHQGSIKVSIGVYRALARLWRLRKEG